jgi:hypothetical protein
MDGQFQDILNGLPDKPPRSRLEPYSALIDELPRRGRTFREITQILGDRCHVKTAASTIHDFVRVRSRREHRILKRSSTGTSRSLSPPTLQAVSLRHLRPIPALRSMKSDDGLRRSKFGSP